MGEGVLPFRFVASVFPCGRRLGRLFRAFVFGVGECFLVRVGVVVAGGREMTNLFFGLVGGPARDR